MAKSLTIKNKNNEILYPKTVSELVYNDNQGTTVKLVLNTKLDVLVSGTNVKTINNNSILGSGNVNIEGESAYQVATRNGFVGTEAQWLESLKGEKGETGNVNVSDGVANISIINDLTTGGTGDALSAEQGIVLDEKISQVEEHITEVESDIQEKFPMEEVVGVTTSVRSGNGVGVFKYTEYKITKGSKYVLGPLGRSASNYTYYLVAACDANKSVVQWLFKRASSIQSVGNFGEEIEAIADASYIRVESYSNYPCTITEHATKLVLQNELDRRSLNRWYSKRWLLIGDSISTENASLADKGYGTLISNSLGLSVYNVAESGKVMSYFYDKIDGYSEKYDLITVMLGTNNQGYNCGIGSLNDSYYQNNSYNSNSSFYAQTQLLYEKLRVKYPTSVIAFITPIKRANPSESLNAEGYKINALNLTTAAYAEAIRQVCAYYSIPCIDIFNTIDPRTETNRSLYFMDLTDGTHPNNLGHALFIAPVIEDGLKRIAPYNENDWRDKFTITENYTNVSSDNTLIFVRDGESFSTTISPSNGYAIRTISITMGGTDITSSVYNYGAITINKVTGNIVITATAEETTMWNITNNFTNVSSDNGLTTVEDGTSYVSHITPLNGYDTIESCSITMGGTDITSSAYSNGTISIPSVTGNIVVTATAGFAIGLRHSYIHSYIRPEEGASYMEDQTGNYNLYSRTQGFANYGRNSTNNQAVNVQNMTLEGNINFTIFVKNYQSSGNANVAYYSSGMTIRTFGNATGLHGNDQPAYPSPTGNLEVRYGTSETYSSSIHLIVTYRNDSDNTTTHFSSSQTSFKERVDWAITYDAATRTITGYVNGTVVGTLVTTVDIAWRGACLVKPFETSTYNVDFDTVQFYNKCLSASEIAALSSE